MHSYKTVVDFVDPNLDVAFGTISDPAFSQALQSGIAFPVRWGDVQQAEDESGSHALLMGYPGNEKKLHATAVKFKNFVDTDLVYDSYQQSLPHTVLCKIIVDGAVFDGMSGGLAADGNGKREFYGIINFTNDATKISGFTPAYAIYEIYTHHYP